MSDPHIPIPPHSCRHCQRVVLRREHFKNMMCRIELPHTVAELEEAITDRCHLIRLFVNLTMMHGRLASREALEFLVSPIESRDRGAPCEAGLGYDGQGLISIGASTFYRTLNIRSPDQCMGDSDQLAMYVSGVQGKSSNQSDQSIFV